MKTIFVALAVLGFIASCTVAQGLRHSKDPNTVLAELDSTPFGSTVLSLVSIHMSTNAPLDELIVLLNQIASQLKNDAAVDAENNATTQQQCKTNIQKLNVEINAFKANLAGKQRDLKKDQASLAQNQADLKDTQAALALNQQRLNAGTKERKEQHETYSKAFLDRENGIKVLDSAIQLAQHLQAGSSFVQLKKRFDKVQNELIETSKASTFGQLYTPLITALSELAEKASPETINRIIKLFNELRADLAKDKQTLTNAENKQMESWISLKADLETEQDALLDKRKALEDSIKELEDSIKKLNAAIAQLKDSLKRSKTNLKNTTAECTREGAAYAKRLALRTAQSNIIRRVIKFFATRAKVTTDFIKQKTANRKL